jgi:tetratricopeptide (TPR) repeat protein
MLAILLAAASLAQNRDSLLMVLTKEKDVSKKVKAYTALCDITEGKALHGLATEFLNYSKLNNSEEGQALAFENLGYYYNPLIPDSGICFYNTALAYYLKKNIPEKISYCYNEIGVGYYIKGELGKSLESYVKSMNHAPKNLNKIKTLNNIAQIYQRMGNRKEAIKSYNRIVNYYDSIQKPIEAAMYRQNLGSMYLESFEYDKAEEYLLKSLNALPETHAAYSHALSNIGLNYTLKGDPEKGKVYLLKAITLLRKENNLRGLAYALTNLGTAYSKLNRNAEAIKYSVEGFELSKQLGFLENIEKISKSMSRIYQNSGDYRNALKYHVIYANTRDSIFSASVVKQINELNAKYESSKKDNELLLQAMELDKKELQIKTQNLEAEKRGKFITALAIAVFFMIVIAIVIFTAYRAKKRNNEELQKLNEALTLSKTETEKQKNIVEEKQKEILDSIHYARRIQQSLLPNKKYISKSLKAGDKSLQ